jgi:hypothetical protein
MNKINTSLAVLSVSINIGSKGKAFPIQVWTGPEGSRRFRFPDFKTNGT